MRYFAIRHKPTGELLPAIESSTSWNPGLRSSRGPRLFHRKTHAAACASWWESGFFANNYEGEMYLVRATPERKNTTEVIEVELNIP